MDSLSKWTQILPLNCCNPKTQTKLKQISTFSCSKASQRETESPANKYKTSQIHIILNLLSNAKIWDQLKHHQELHGIFLHSPHFTSFFCLRRDVRYQNEAHLTFSPWRNQEVRKQEIKTYERGKFDEKWVEFITTRLYKINRCTMKNLTAFGLLLCMTGMVVNAVFQTKSGWGCSSRQNFCHNSLLSWVQS